jgi:hypothetical protein
MTGPTPRQQPASVAGVTTATDMGYAPLSATGSWEDLHEVLVPLADAGQLPLRIQAFLPLPDW